MSQLRHRLIASRYVYDEAALNDRFEFARKVFPDLAQTPWPTAQAGDHRVLSGFSAEGQLAGEHLEGQDAERVDIAAAVEGLAADLLRDS